MKSKAIIVGFFCILVLYFSCMDENFEIDENNGISGTGIPPVWTATHGGDVYSIDTKNNCFISSGSNRCVKFWEATTTQPPYYSLINTIGGEIPWDPSNVKLLYHDGAYYGLFASGDGMVQRWKWWFNGVWNMSNPPLTYDSFSRDTENDCERNPVHALFYKTYNRCLAAFRDSLAYLFLEDDRTIIRYQTLDTDDGDIIWAMDFKNNGHCLTGGTAGNLKEWFPEQSPTHIRGVNGAHKDCIRCIKFNPSNYGRAISCSNDCKIKYWNVSTTISCLRTLDKDNGYHTYCVSSVDIIEYDSHVYMLSGSDDGTLKISEILTNDSINLLNTISTDQMHVNSVAFLTYGNKLYALSAGYNGTIKCYYLYGQ